MKKYFYNLIRKYTNNHNNDIISELGRIVMWGDVGQLNLFFDKLKGKNVNARKLKNVLTDFYDGDSEKMLRLISFKLYEQLKNDKKLYIDIFNFLWYNFSTFLNDLLIYVKQQKTE